MRFKSNIAASDNLIEDGDVEVTNYLHEVWVFKYEEFCAKENGRSCHKAM